MQAQPTQVAASWRCRDDLVAAGARRRLAIHIVEQLSPGGIETLVLDLVRSSTERDLIFSLSGRTDDLLRDWPALLPVRDHIEAFDRPAGISPLLVLNLAKRLKALRPAAVVVHHIGPLLYGGLAAKLARVPRIIHVEHDAWHYQEKRRGLLLAAASRLCGTRHVAVSRQIASVMGQYLPGKRITVIPPGIDTDRFKPRSKYVARDHIGLDHHGIVIGTVGRLVAEKGHIYLIEALKHLESNVRLAVVGDGPHLATLQSHAHRLGLASRVHFLRHRDDVESIYPAFDVFCLPSLVEGLPRSALEAQACGIPVVASNVGALSEAVCPRTGTLVPAADPQAIANALQAVVARRMARWSPREHVVATLSWLRTEAAYREMIEGTLP